MRKTVWSLAAAIPVQKSPSIAWTLRGVCGKGESKKSDYVHNNYIKESFTTMLCSESWPSLPPGPCPQVKTCPPSLRKTEWNLDKITWKMGTVIQYTMAKQLYLNDGSCWRKREIKLLWIFSCVIMTQSHIGIPSPGVDVNGTHRYSST